MNGHIIGKGSARLIGIDVEKDESDGSTTDPYESCPECGADMAMKVQPSDGLIGDGDEVSCPSCGYETALSVDEDGKSWLQN